MSLLCELERFMEVKTYTKRTNARRAGVASGVPFEQVEITIHKQGGEVRFGWKRRGTDSVAQGPVQGAPGTLGASHPKKRPQRPIAAAQREVRNGVKRPSPGGLCAQVWEWLDAHPGATVKDVKAAAPEQAWNLGNATFEFYAWRRFNSLSSNTTRPG